VLQVGGIEIVVSEVASSTNDPELLRRHGIEPTDKAILALKVKNHFHAAFDPIIAKSIDVDLPGLAAMNFGTFSYRNIPRPIFPLDSDAQYPRR
jgi:microcystin degradation protein MlrC